MVSWPGSQSAGPSRAVFRNVSPMHDPPGRSHGRGGGIVSIPSLLGTEPWKLSGPARQAKSTRQNMTPARPGPPQTGCAARLRFDADEPKGLTLAAGLAADLAEQPGLATC
jgi:hypothetical protein